MSSLEPMLSLVASLGSIEKDDLFLGEEIPAGHYRQPAALRQQVVGARNSDLPLSSFIALPNVPHIRYHIQRPPLPFLIDPAHVLPEDADHKHEDRVAQAQDNH